MGKQPLHHGKQMSFPMATALVQLTVERDKIDTVSKEIAGMEGVSEVYSVGGCLDAGLNIMFPLVCVSGTDLVILRKQYGCNLLYMGGVDKKKIARGGDENVLELEYLALIVEEGGYIPHCDNLCPSDVTFENYRFYLMKKREIFGIMQKEERIRKSPADV